MRLVRTRVYGMPAAAGWLGRTVGRLSCSAGRLLHHAIVQPSTPADPGIPLDAGLGASKPVRGQLRAALEL